MLLKIFRPSARIYLIIKKRMNYGTLVFENKSRWEETRITQLEIDPMALNLYLGVLEFSEGLSQPV